MWKGLDIVVRAIEIAKEKIPGIYLYVSRAQLQKGLARKMVQSLGLEGNVTICGSIPYGLYYKLLSSVDLLLHALERVGIRDSLPGGYGFWQTYSGI